MRYTPSSVPSRDLNTFLGFELKRIAESYKPFYIDNVDGLAVVDGQPAAQITHDGLPVLTTFDRGIQLKSTVASNTYIDFIDSAGAALGLVGYNNSGDLIVFNEQVSGHVTLEAKNASSVNKELLRGDPDAATELMYQGTVALKTRLDGIAVHDPNGNDPLIRFYDDAGTVLSRLQHVSNDISIYNETHGGTINFTAETSGGTVTTIQQMDPDNGYIRSYLGHYFGATVAANAADLSTHIALWSSTYGFCITSSTLNLVVPGTGQHVDVPVGGFVVGAPTGGNKGTGNINAKGVYDDNVLLCQPVEDAVRPGRSSQEWRDMFGGNNELLDRYESDKAAGWDGTRIGWRTMLEATGAVPGLPNREEIKDRMEEYSVVIPDDGTLEGERVTENINNKFSIGEKTERIWLALDYMAVALKDALDKIDELETQISDSQ